MSSDEDEQTAQQQQLAEVGTRTDAGAGASTLSTLTAAAANAAKAAEAKAAPAEASPTAGLAARPPRTLVRSAKVPADWDELIDWLEDDTQSPGMREIAQAVDSVLRELGVKTGPVPTTWERHHTGNIWGELYKCSGIDVSHLKIGKYVFKGSDPDLDRVEASKDKWWARDGQKVVATLADAIRGRSSGHNMSKDEVSAKVLTASECTSIVRSTTWTGTFKSIQAGDLAGAQAQLDGQD